MINRTISIPPALAAGSVFLIAMGFALYVDMLLDRSFRSSERAIVGGYLAELRSSMQYTIGDHIGALQTADALVLSQPDLDDATFQTMAESLSKNLPAIREIQLSPDGIIQLVYPPESAASVRGLNLLKLPGQREVILDSIEKRILRIAGPLPLKQGGIGLIARKPIFVETEGPKNFWGFVTIILDFPRFMAQFENLPAFTRADMAIRGRNGSGATGESFYGSPDFFSRDIITEKVRLPYGEWQLGAAPDGGWSRHRLQRKSFLATALLLSMLLGSLVYLIRSRGIALAAKTQQLQDSEARFALAAEGTTDGLWDWPDTRQPAMWFSKRFYELIGYAPGEISATIDHFLEMIHPEDRTYLTRSLKNQDGSGAPFQDEFRIITRQGEHRWFLLRGASSRSRNGIKVRISGSIQDIMAAKLAEAKVQEMLRERLLQANHDALTGMLNRRGFEERWDIEVARARRHGQVLLVMILDADHFKAVNDNFGHGIGDELLRHFGITILETLRDTDIAARFGGEEFVIVLVETPLAEGIRIANRLRQAIGALQVENGRGAQISVTCSIGMTLHRVDASFDDSLRAADAALYQAKEQGRDRVIAAPQH